MPSPFAFSIPLSRDQLVKQPSRLSDAKQLWRSVPPTVMTDTLQ
jgi:hypothetical protein